MSSDIIFVDTETTDLVKPEGTNLKFQPYITEICIIRTNKKIKEIDCFVSRFEVPVPVTVGAYKRTGITNEMLMGEPKFSEKFKPIKKIMSGAKEFVAQNLRFDKALLEIEAKRINKKIKFPPSLFCTVEQSMHYLGFRMTSVELYDYIGSQTEIKNIHSAKGDVLAMIEYYKFIKSGFLPEFFKEVM